jgi:hypothetical protein
MEEETSSKNVQNMSNIVDKNEKLTLTPGKGTCYIHGPYIYNEVDNKVRTLIAQKLLNEKVITTRDYGRIMSI